MRFGNLRLICTSSLCTCKRDANIQHEILKARYFYRNTERFYIFTTLSPSDLYILLFHELWLTIDDNRKGVTALDLEI